jgi:isopentenyl diphosphate isomerase/L-lactate dehydrogenase-like FMN-dependent dehydrogenase
VADSSAVSPSFGRGEAAEAAAEKPFALVFHGGSGSRPEEIAEAVSHGVVKMNVDTDTQYAFTRAVAGHMFEHYAGVLKIDGEVGEKRFYDPRSWGREAESSMAARIVEACQQPRFRWQGTEVGQFWAVAVFRVPVQLPEAVHIAGRLSRFPHHCGACAGVVSFERGHPSQGPHHRSM